MLLQCHFFPDMNISFYASSESNFEIGFVRWAAEQIELYAEIFRRQIYGADQDPQAIQDSLGVTMTHAGMVR